MKFSQVRRCASRIYVGTWLGVHVYAAHDLAEFEPDGAGGVAFHVWEAMAAIVSVYHTEQWVTELGITWSGIPAGVAQAVALGLPSSRREARRTASRWGVQEVVERNYQDQQEDEHGEGT